MSAELAIRLIDEGGAPPIGQPAPANVGQTTIAPPQPVVQPSSASANQQEQRRDSAPKQESSRDAVTLGEGMAALARVGGFGAVVTATQMLQDAIRGLQAGPSTSTPSIKTNRSSPGSGDQPMPPPVIEGEGAAAAESESAAGMAGEAAGAASIAGPALIAVGAVIGLGVAAKKATDALEEDARKLSEYNAQLAGAEAIADLRKQLAEMRRAQENGRDLADAVDSLSRIQTATYDIFTKLENWALKIADPALKLIANSLEDLTGNQNDPFAGDPFTEQVMGNLIGYSGLHPNATAARAGERQAFVGAALEGVGAGIAGLGGI